MQACELLRIILSYASPIFGFVGTVLIFLYGVPKHIDNDGANIVVSGIDEEEKQRIKKYKRLSNLGLFGIALSFLLQLLLLFI
jgi:hypothetical protein